MSQATERYMHPSMAQINLLVDMLDKNPNIAKSYLKTQNAKKKSQKFWENAALQLNSIGGGTFKDWKKWMKLLEGAGSMLGHHHPLRRTQFISITDRFLRVEERRLELEERNADLMRAVFEQSNQRDQAMIDAVTPMGNVMAGAIKALGDGLIASSDAIKSC